jgi:hypothetical protein
LKSYALTYTGWQVFKNLVHLEAKAQGAPKVLGRRFQNLPKTGAAPGWPLFLVLLVPAVLLARKLRDTFWV